MSTFETIAALEDRVAELEKRLENVIGFDTNIKVDGVTKPIKLLVVDKTGTLHPPKPAGPTFTVVRDGE